MEYCLYSNDCEKTSENNLLHSIYADRLSCPHGINRNMNISLKIWYLTRIDWFGCALEVVSTDLHHVSLRSPTNLAFLRIWLLWIRKLSSRIPDEYLNSVCEATSDMLHECFVSPLHSHPKKNRFHSSFLFQIRFNRMCHQKTNKYELRRRLRLLCLFRCRHSNRNTANCRRLVRLFDE